MNHEDTVFISNDSHTPNDKATTTVHTAYSSSICCVFRFLTNKTDSANLVQELLQSLLYDFSHFHDMAYSYVYADEIKTDSAVSGISTQQQAFLVYIKADSTCIVSFCDMLSKTLPMSFNFIFQDIQQVDMIDFAKYPIPQKIISKIPSVLQLNSFIDSKHENFYNITPFVKIMKFDNMKANHINAGDSVNFQKHNTELKTLDTNTNFIKQIVAYLAYQILESKKVILQCNNRVFALSRNYDNNIVCRDTQDNRKRVIFADLYNALSYLRLNDSQKTAIASFEKPFIKAYSKDAFSSCFDSSVLFAALPNDCIIFLLFYHLRQFDESIDYLFYCNIESPYNIMVHYVDTSATDLSSFDNTFSVSKDGIMMTHSKQHKNLLDILYTNPTQNQRFIVYLSSHQPSQFLIENPKNIDSRFQEILNIDILLSLVDYLKTLYHYKNGDKLIKNFVKENITLAQTWNLSEENIMDLGLHDLLQGTNTNKDSPIYNRSQNLLDIFLIIEQLLGLKNSVIEIANKCLRDRGPRIDYKLIRHNDSIILDFPRLLRSVMSFQLAGVEHELLCYGIIDSMAEFIGVLASDMMLNYGVNEVFIGGDLLLEQCFLDKITNAIPKNMVCNITQHTDIYKSFCAF